jgi:ComF family protein
MFCNKLTLKVKTMQIFESVIDIFAPHSCVECGLEGALVCDGCQMGVYMAESQSHCVTCDTPTAPSTFLCEACASSSDVHHIWAIGPHVGSLERLIEMVKFQRARAAALQLATGLNYTLPPLASATTIMAIPTATSRIRQRGYDQVQEIAKHLSRLRNVQRANGLERQHGLRQVGADREQRRRQAQTAFSPAPVLATLARDTPILLVDDVLTTGATIFAAAAVLQSQGFTNVAAAVGAFHSIAR